MASTILADNGASSGSAGIKTSADSTGVLALQTTTAGGAATTAVTIDTSQNVGVGVVPSSWTSGYKALQLSTGGLAATGVVNFFQGNGYNDGSWKFYTTGYANQIFQDSSDGSTTWRVSTASGSAGGAVTWSTQMKLDASGNLGVGTTSPGKKLDVNGDIRASSSLIITSNGTGSITDGANTYVGLSSSQLTLRTDTAIPIVALTNGTERVRIDSSGNLLVGVTSQLGTGLLSVYRGNTTNYCATIRNDYAGTRNFVEFYATATSVGSITSNGTSTTYGTSSDYRLKENIAPMTGALETVSQLKPCTYTWKVDGSEGQGFIAHELQAVVPDAVTGEKDAVNEDGSPKYQSIDTSFLVATLTAAIQEQQAIITQLQADVAALKGQA